MQVTNKTFSSSTQSWESLMKEAAEFATQVGRDRLINISMAAAGGTDLFGGIGAQGLVVVWYWE